ncbi:hypothetical protein Q4R52_20260, partial [Morganella morganii]
MPRPTDTNTTLSLSASTLGDLCPQTLSGGEALNELGSLTLGGYSATALTLSNAVATISPPPCTTTPTSVRSTVWSR